MRQATLENQQGEAQRQIADRAEELDRLQAELEIRQREVEESRRWLEAQLTAATLENEVTSAGPDGEPSPVQTEADSLRECPVDAGDCSAEAAPIDLQEPSQPSPPTDAADPAAEPSPPPTKGAPVNLVEILRRTGFSVDAGDEEPAATDSVAAKDAAEETPEPASANITAPALRVRKAASAEDEVSIDDYMSHLLARNRGDSAPVAPAAPRPKTTVPSAPVNTPPPAAAKPAPVAVAPAPSPQQPVKPIEMAPRAVAPEKNIDLQAMRQLANFSANTAISKHENKLLTISTRTKLAVTLAAGFSGTVLLGLTISGGSRLLTGVLAMASFAVAGLWGTNYVALTKKMIGARMAQLERHLKAGQEAPPDETAEGAPTAPGVDQSAAVPANADPGKEGE